MRSKKLLVAFVLVNVFVISNFAVTQHVSATAGTAGKVSSTVGIYNPGTPDMLELTNLVDGEYYAVLIGSNLATANQQWDNFTASGNTKYINFEVDNGNFASTDTKLVCVLYGATNDTDTSATQLDSYEFSLVFAQKILGYDWFMTNIFPILIFFIIIGIVVGIISVIYVQRRGKGRSYQD